ncbi:MAG: hypothetical protein AAF682_05550 [Planctomycetota bacterium]
MRALLLAPLLALPCAAQTELFTAGDILPGFGLVELIRNPDIDDPTGWVVIASRDEGAFLPDYRRALVRNKAVLLQTGDDVGVPSAFVDDIRDVDVSSAGDRACYVELKVTDVPGTVSALLFNEVPIALAGDLVAAPGVPAGTVYQSFDGVSLDDQLRLLAYARFENGSEAPRGAYVLFRLDAAGTVLSEELLVQEGDLLGGQPIDRLNPGQFDLGDQGKVIYTGDLGPSGDALNFVGINRSVLVIDGDPSPWGSDYNYFLEPQLDEAGNHAFWTGVGGGERGIVRNGAAFRFEGDLLPQLPGPITEVTADGLWLTEDGATVYTAEWDGGEGVFVDDALLVDSTQLIAGEPFLSNIALHARADGTGVAVTYYNAAVNDTLFAWIPDVDGVPGCGANEGTLALAQGDASAGTTAVFELDQGQAPGVIAFLGWSLDGTSPGGCGTTLPGLGELLIGPELVALSAPATWSGTPLAVSVPFPPLAASATVFGQGVFLDTTGVAPGEPVRLTSGLQVFVGP